MRFIDRESDLEALENHWREEVSQLMVVYGKRRVGKTELLKQFIKDKPGVYFLADRRPENQQLPDLAGLLARHFQDPFLEATGFTDWISVFTYLADRVKEPFVLAIDEFPFLTENNRAASSLFQKGWDEYLSKTPIYLILCGSSIAMMESEVLGVKAPLYGRRTGQLLLQPLEFPAARLFFPKLSFEDALARYAVAGGTPAYLIKLDADLSLEAVVQKRIWARDSFLNREVEFLLREELREPRNYLAILQAIALGKHKYGEITNATGMAKNILTKYLHVLEDLALIRKEFPVTEGQPLRSKKGLYKLSDSFFYFWFNYVLPYRSDLEMGDYSAAQRQWKKTFPGMVESTYEETACSQIKRGQDRYFEMERVGRWWDRMNEIDIVGLGRDEKSILFGEAKWSRKAVGTNIYENLKSAAKAVIWGPDDRTEHFCLFSRSGFTAEMKKVARSEGVTLYEGDRVIG